MLIDKNGKKSTFTDISSNKKEGGGLQLTAFLYRNADIASLKPKEFVVYCCLLRHSDKNTDNCFPSRRLITDECSMDKKTVDSALKELEA